MKAVLAALLACAALAVLGEVMRASGAQAQ